MLGVLSNSAQEGFTVLLSACYGGQTEVARLLLDRGADVNKADNVGFPSCMCRTLTFFCRV